MQETAQPLSKLDQVKALEYQVIGIDKHIKLIGQFNTAFATEFSAGKDVPPLPPISIKCNPQYFNYTPLDPRFLPMETSKFIAAYLKNAEDMKKDLQKEIDSIFSGK